MITKYVCGRDWETPHVVELIFEEDGDLLVAPIGHRKKTRYLLGGHYFTHKADSTLSDTYNEAIDKAIAHLRAKIKPVVDRINTLSMLKVIEPYFADVHHAPALGISLTDLHKVGIPAAYREAT